MASSASIEPSRGTRILWIAIALAFLGGLRPLDANGMICNGGVTAESVPKSESYSEGAGSGGETYAPRWVTAAPSSERPDGRRRLREIVLVDQPVKGLPIYPCLLGRRRDVAVVAAQDAPVVTGDLDAAVAPSACRVTARDRVCAMCLSARPGDGAGGASVSYAHGRDHRRAERAPHERLHGLAAGKTELPRIMPAMGMRYCGSHHGCGRTTTPMT